MGRAAGVAVCLGLLGCSASEDEPRPNVVIVLIDTLRADQLPCYGAVDGVAPFLSRLAASGVVFESAWSTSSWTAPATASIFSGVYPFQHGVLTGFFRTLEKSNDHARIRINTIPGSAETIPELLKRLGYRTFGIADNVNVREELGFHAGFDAFASFNYRTAERVNEQLADWADEIRRSDPYFVYLHYMDMHTPYRPRDGVEVPRVSLPRPDIGAGDLAHPIRQGMDLLAEGLASGMETALEAAWNGVSEREKRALRRFVSTVADGDGSDRAARDWLRARLHDYVAELQYLDAQIEEAFAILGVDDDDLVILLADHGEEFGDHGNITHPFQLYPELLRVPLVVRWPNGGIEPGRVEDPVNTLSVLPTLRDLLGEKPSRALPGRSLVPALLSGDRLEPKPLFAMRQRRSGAYLERLVAVVDGPHLLVMQDGVERPDELYDVVADPLAQDDVAAERPGVVGALRDQWDHFEANARRYEREFSDPFELDPELEQHIRELGYVGDR